MEFANKFGKFVRGVQEVTNKGPALPHGKQGILISVETGDYMRGGKEAVNVLSDV